MSVKNESIILKSFVDPFCGFVLIIKINLIGNVDQKISVIVISKAHIKKEEMFL